MSSGLPFFMTALIQNIGIKLPDDQPQLSPPCIAVQIKVANDHAGQVCQVADVSIGLP